MAFRTSNEFGRCRRACLLHWSNSRRAGCHTSGADRGASHRDADAGAILGQNRLNVILQRISNCVAMISGRRSGHWPKEQRFHQGMDMDYCIRFCNPHTSRLTCCAQDHLWHCDQQMRPAHDRRTFRGSLRDVSEISHTGPYTLGSIKPPRGFRRRVWAASMAAELLQHRTRSAPRRSPRRSGMARTRHCQRFLLRQPSDFRSPLQILDVFHRLGMSVVVASDGLEGESYRALYVVLYPIGLVFVITFELPSLHRATFPKIPLEP